MRYSASEKYEIIRLVEDSGLSVTRTLARLGIRKSTFYGWLKRYQDGDMEALKDRKPCPRSPWNKLPEGPTGGDPRTSAGEARVVASGTGGHLHG